jgi:hypothetical protein
MSHGIFVSCLLLFAETCISCVASWLHVFRLSMYTDRYFFVDVLAYQCFGCAFILEFASQLICKDHENESST